MQRSGNMRWPMRWALPAAIIAGAAPVAEPAAAGVVVHGTRVIYPADRREVTVELRNNGTSPSLVQAWIDDGASSSTVAKAPVPFALTPAIFRVDPDNGQSLRIIYTGRPLATDRETVFWLNVLDIPPKAPSNPDAPNRLDFAFRHRMKIFFRPAAVQGNPADSSGRIVWTVRSERTGKFLDATNPTPFHASLTKIEVLSGSASFAAEARMVEPFATASFPLAATIPLSAARVRYAFVDDFGAIRTGEAPVQASAAGN